MNYCVRRARKWSVGLICVLFFYYAAFAPLASESISLPGETAVVSVQSPIGKEARSTVLFVTGKNGWTPEHAIRAERLADLHTLVIGIDGGRLLALADGDCLRAVGMLPMLATKHQEDVGALARLPVLAALSGGTSLVLQAASEAPANYKGIVTKQFGVEPSICSKPDQIAVLAGKAPVRWLNVASEEFQPKLAALRGLKRVLPIAGPRKAFYRSYLGVAGTDSAFDLRIRETDIDLRVLPLTIHATTGSRQSYVYAIFLSGDGGWAGFDEQISNLLAESGMPVVGISTLRYLWHERTPAQIAKDISRIDNHFSQRFGRRNVVLIGFSLGANVTPFYVPYLPVELQSRIAGIGLIAPEERTGFEIVVGGWLGRMTGSHPVGPQIERLAMTVTRSAISCLFGTKETTNPCPGLDAPNIRRVAFDGGHHLGKAHEDIAVVLSDLVRDPRRGALVNARSNAQR